jgi:hypothetical protein
VLAGDAAYVESAWRSLFIGCHGISNGRERGPLHRRESASDARFASGVCRAPEPLVQTTGDLKVFEERYGKATKENVVAFLTFDTDNPNSILLSARCRENARTVREIISRNVGADQQVLPHGAGGGDRRPYQ